MEGEKLTASDGAAADFFGDAVSLSSAHALIGGFGDDDNGEESGSAYVYSGFSATTAILVPVEVDAPTIFELFQNYPNPFNPSTSIKYSVPEAGNIKLSVYNVVGEEIAVLINGYTAAGSFDVTFDASKLPSGVYLYKLKSANSVQTKKMMLLK